MSRLGRLRISEIEALRQHVVDIDEKIIELTWRSGDAYDGAVNELKEALRATVEPVLNELR